MSAASAIHKAHLGNLQYISNRSVNEYIAQMFGAQYAWQSPREKGKSRLRT